jgi:DNA-binding CsgD family transcriptional regulator
VDLVFRDPTSSDFEQCLSLLSSPLQRDPAHDGVLLDMWNHINRARCGFQVLSADPADITQIIHFGFGVYVSDECAAEYRRCVHPLIAQRMVADWRAGRKQFLTVDELARSNAGDGLNLLVTHYGHRDGDPRAFIANYEGSRRALAGLNIRTFTAEIFTTSERDDRSMGASLGYRVLEYDPAILQTYEIPPEHAPFVWTAERDDRTTGKYAPSLLFATYSPPRFRFSDREQRLLLLALEGGTDASIARALVLSESAVKKHFRTIYDKVSNVAGDEELFDVSFDKRGAEARRHLLNYLRDHLEELRPYRYDRNRSKPGGTTVRSAAAPR